MLAEITEAFREYKEAMDRLAGALIIESDTLSRIEPHTNISCTESKLAVDKVDLISLNYVNLKGWFDNVRAAE